MNQWKLATGISITTKKAEVLCLSKNLSHCALQLQVTRITLQQAGTFKYLGVVFTTELRRNREFDTRSCKTNAVLREGYRFLVTKQEYWTTANIKFLNQSLFRSSRVVMNLLVTVQRQLPQVQTAEMWVLRRVRDVQLRDKVRSGKIRAVKLRDKVRSGWICCVKLRDKVRSG